MAMANLARLTAFVCAFVSLITPSLAATSNNPNITRTITLSPPDTPAPGRQIVDASYTSFSIEFSYMADYAGNDTNPNLFSSQVVQNFYDISGAYPIFRVGGSTQNSAVYYSNQTEAIIDPFDSAGSDQPSHSFLGPDWMQSFRQFPNGTQYIYGLNFFNPVNETLFKVGDGLDQCVLEAHAAYTTLGDSLYAFEIGNEVDGWTNSSRRSANWSIQSYVTQWNQYATAISQNLSDGAHDSLKLFQGCAFEAPRHVTDSTAWNVLNAEMDGMTADKAKTVADHEYMGANCHYTGTGPTIEKSLLNRTNMLSHVWFHDYLGNLTTASDPETKYVLGETNSLSCQGSFNISDVMASAIWAVDYVMYLSSLQVSRVHFHMGTRYRYSAWQPIFYNETEAHVKPIYYGNLFTATVFAGGNKQTEVLVNETSFGAYGVYSWEEGKGEESKALESIVAVNLNVWNSTFDPAERPYTALKLPKGWDNATVSRLTSPGVDIAENITFQGQVVDDRGKIVRVESVEGVEGVASGASDGGEVLVGAGEAVLVRI